jgi:hypothetical protein
MDKTLLGIGRTAGILGVAISAAAVALRLGGRYRMGGFEVGTLLDAGVATMVFACLCYIAVQAERHR